METFVQTFSDLIRDRLGELRLNAFAAENAAGLPPDAIRNVLRSEKQAGPTLARTKEICDALGLEIRIAPKSMMAQLDASITTRINDDGTSPPSGFVTIPWLEPRIGAGSAPICFSRRWLDDHGLQPDFLAATMPDDLAVDCVSGTDTLALLDNRSSNRNGHGIWCYRAKGKVVVARMTFAASSTIIHAADPENAPTVLEGRLEPTLAILGKVVWLGQSIPFKGKVG